DLTKYFGITAEARALVLITIYVLRRGGEEGGCKILRRLGWQKTAHKIQCGVNPYYSDDGNGVVKSSTCQSSPVYVTGNDPKDAYVPLLDSPGSSDPAGSVYRNQWVAALAAKYGSQPHWYNMDNEIDIWAGTHRDIHPNNMTYDEMKNTFLSEARLVKSWDPAAVILDQVGCCWWYYWNDEASTKSTHGGVDFLPWWLNEIYWADQMAGSRSLDVFDLHAYPDADHPGFTTDQLRAQELRVMRDWWDPTYISESSTINQQWTTQTQPNLCHIGDATCKSVPFRIPRLRAILNSEYPNTPLSFTEWNAAFVTTSD